MQALTLDCLSQVERLERLESLTKLSSLAIGIDKLDLNPLLASRNLHTLQRLRVFQEVGPKLDLAPVSQMPHLRGLHLNAKVLSLQPVAHLVGLTELSLYRQPASSTFEGVAQLPDLHRLAIGFGSREAMLELSSDSVRHLSLCRVRGLHALELERFPRLEVLDVEDQPHLARLALAPCSRLRALRLANLKSLASLDGLGDVPLARLCVYKTPALDLLALLEQALPGLEAVRLVSGKRALDQQLEARREALGITLLSGAF